MPYVVGKVMRFDGRDVQPGDILTDEEARVGNLRVLLKTRRLYLQGTEPDHLKTQNERPAPPLSESAAAPPPIPSGLEEPKPKSKKKKRKSNLSGR